jgi:NADH-quinone oxidoreductase subunit N
VHAAVAWREAAVPLSSSAGVAFDRLGLATGTSGALLVTTGLVASVPFLRRIDEERGDLYALFCVCGASLTLLMVANHLLVVTSALVLWQVAASVLLAPDRDGPHGVEAAAKSFTQMGLVIVLLTLASALAYGATGSLALDTLGRSAANAEPLALVSVACVLVALGCVLGVMPLHQTFVDGAQGGSPSTSGLLVGGAHLAGATLALRVLSALGDGHAPYVGALAAVAMATLVLPALSALDQTRVSRMVAYLVASQAGLIVAALAAFASTSSSDAAASVVLASSCAAWPGAAALVCLAVPELRSSATWEDWSGLGRKHPVFAAALLYVLASLAGLPGTAGFHARLAVARAAFAGDQDVLGLVVLGSVAIAAAPLLRLGIFLYAKEPDVRLRIEPSGLRTWSIGAIVVVTAGLGLWPQGAMQLAQAITAFR